MATPPSSPCGESEIRFTAESRRHRSEKGDRARKGSAEIFGTFSWETSERIGAMLEARVEDYQRPHLLVRAEARKGRKRDKCYRLTDATCDRIEQLIAGRSEGRVFDWPMTSTHLWGTFGRAVKAAGLDTKHRGARPCDVLPTITAADQAGGG
jgi:hypothetical protein